ncbi:glycoside hydrolase family 18 protein [Xylariaceae sp. AK1471]|nr:glycoside hydrolase family 18 protein [Xylariaceae sp. AK1471]
MTGALSLYLASVLLIAGSVAPTAAIKLRDDPSTGLDEWRASNDRTSSVKMCPSSCADDPDDLSSQFFDQILATVIRGCKADYSPAVAATDLAMTDDNVAAVCTIPNHDIVDMLVTIGRPSGGTAAGTDKHSNNIFGSSLLLAGYQVRNFLSSKEPNCTENVLAFGYSQGAVFNLFAGAQVYQHGVHADILSRFLQDLKAKATFSEPLIAQLCPPTGLGADYAVGIVAGSVDDLSLIRGNYMTASMRIPALLEASPSNSSSPSNFSSILTSNSSRQAVLPRDAQVWTRSGLAARATCKTTTVKSGDGCDAVASRCGITTANLQKYNTASNFCNTLVPDQVVCCSSGALPDPIPAANSDGTCKSQSVVSGDSCGSLASKCGLKAADFTKLHPASDYCATLQVGQRVCCTHGILPDIVPKPNADGSCLVYTVQSGDGCSVIAASHDITQAKIETYNKKTWAWNGCKALLPGQTICLSTGTPPFPVSVSNAVCGPQVPGTKKPTSGTSDTWANLNPCPLNVCCNVWGMCGVTDDFCVINPADTGAPGTTQPKKNSCISNCGRDIIKGSAPAETMRIDTSKYTHIHFAFANITSAFDIDVSGVQAQFDDFKALTDVKRIITFGGWDFSTAPGTYNILREATRAANRAKFESNIVAFVKTHNLDGVDVDWEYPGAPDIHGIPAGDADAGEDLHQTLMGLKSTFGTSRSVSLAAPASYWYLKAFPIKEIGAKVDYIVYLTYDLHGQWDYGNPWTSPGCATGNCLRSHVNLTETKDALSLITKAGVPSNKVVVGVASYGRSFKMATAGCSGPNCLFTGSPRVSNAAKGRCTGTSGYLSDAEISEIIATGNVNKQWIDADSNILVYNDTEWVACMNTSIKKSRETLYASYNFAGTSEWAVDLEEFVDNSGVDDNDPDYDTEIDEDYYADCKRQYTTLDQLLAQKDNERPYCVDQYLVDIEIEIMRNALTKYNRLIQGGYDKKFKVYEEYTKKQVPDLINSFMDNGHADDYFGCQQTGNRQCCSSCHYSCSKNCDKSKGCESGISTWDVTCPIVYANGPLGIDYFNIKVPNVTYTYTLRDSDGFYSAISNDYGVDKDWIKFGNTDVGFENWCQYAGKDVKECIMRTDEWFWNYPGPADDIKVFNPKDIVEKSHGNFADLLDRLQLMKSITTLDSFLTMTDVADAAAIPALTVQNAIDNMDKVVDEAKEIEKRERQELIAGFLGGILFLIPFVGGALDAGLVAIRTGLRIAEAAGEAALLAFTVVQDPDNAFEAVFSTLAGAGLSRGSWTKAANEPRGLGEEDPKKLGTIHDDLSKIDNIRGGVCRL